MGIFSLPELLPLPSITRREERLQEFRKEEIRKEEQKGEIIWNLNKRKN